MAEEESKSKVLAGYAPSGRAACKAAKACLHPEADGKAGKIDKNAVRITKSMVVEALGDHPMEHHYHADCFFKVAIARARSETLKNLEPSQIEGFGALKAEDQALCNAFFKEGKDAVAAAAEAKASKGKGKGKGKKRAAEDEEEGAGAGAAEGAAEDQEKPKKKARKSKKATAEDDE